MKAKILIVELNEFNSDLLAKGANKLGLKNINIIILELLDDIHESQGLDWVHNTGKPSSIHNVLRI